VPPRPGDPAAPERGPAAACPVAVPSGAAASCRALAGAGEALPSRSIGRGWLFVGRTMAAQVYGPRTGLAPDTSGLQADSPVTKPAVGPARLLGKQRLNGREKAVRYRDL